MPTRATALLVDDDPVIADTLRIALGGRPITLDVAYDLPTALRCLDSSRYDGLILDLCLPQGSGFDVLRHMRARKITLPTVVISKNLPDYVRDMLAIEHVKEVLLKPVQTTFLVRTILRICGVDGWREHHYPAPHEANEAEMLWRLL